MRVIRKLRDFHSRIPAHRPCKGVVSVVKGFLPHSGRSAGALVHLLPGMTAVTRGQPSQTPDLRTVLPGSLLSLSPTLCITSLTLQSWFQILIFFPPWIPQGMLWFAGYYEIRSRRLHIPQTFAVNAPHRAG